MLYCGCALSSTNSGWLQSLRRYCSAWNACDAPSFLPFLTEAAFVEPAPATCIAESATIASCATSSPETTKRVVMSLLIVERAKSSYNRACSGDKSQ